MGGETLLTDGRVNPADGLSPRGRGNPLLQVRDRMHLRSIPAWAGKPMRNGERNARSRVYPRVGGETLRGRILPA